MSQRKRHRNFKCLLLGERNQFGETICSVTPTVWASGKSKHIETLKRSWFPGLQGEGGRKKGLVCA